MSNYLQVARQLEAWQQSAIHNSPEGDTREQLGKQWTEGTCRRDQHGPTTLALEEAMAIVQHHDGVSVRITAASKCSAKSTQSCFVLRLVLVRS